MEDKFIKRDQIEIEQNEVLFTGNDIVDCSNVRSELFLG